MIVVRNLESSDILTPPHWPISPLRPEPSTTLVAVEDGNIVGLIWMAYGGEAAMIVGWQSAIPTAAIPLWVAARKLAKDMGCMSLFSFSPESRLLDVMASRGWYVDTTPHYPMVLSTTMKLEGGRLQCPS